MSKKQILVVDDSFIMRTIIKDIVERRVNTTGVSEPVVTTQGADRVVVELPGVTDPESLKVETISGELRPGFQILLCSDGLTEEVDDQQIANLLAQTDLSAQECVDHLVSTALDGGGSDNVTVVLLRRV